MLWLLAVVIGGGCTADVRNMPTHMEVREFASAVVKELPGHLGAQGGSFFLPVFRAKKKGDPLKKESFTTRGSIIFPPNVAKRPAWLSKGNRFSFSVFLFWPMP